MSFRRDMTLGGRYQLTDRIAGGGMGEVWGATDLVLRRSVAVKLLKPELLDEPGFLDRFRAEARHTAALSHSGIAGIFDYGEDQHVAYLVMELVNGESLSAMLARNGALPTEMVLSILAQTTDALGAAHQAGVVHRDVKPGNLLVTPDGTVKVTDFGISKVIDSVPLTATGQVLGTPQYISPEQATGSSATAASDLYSLGVIGYEMLVGRRPFTGDTPLALAMAHVQEAPPPLPDSVPKELAAAISSMLSKDPSGRPADAAALAARFRSMRSSGPAPATLPGSAPGVLATSQATVLHTALGPSAWADPVPADPATTVAPAQVLAAFANPAAAADDVSVAPLGQGRHQRQPAAVIAFVLILLITIVAVLATRNGEGSGADEALTDAAATSVAPDAAATSVAPDATGTTVAAPVVIPPTDAPTTVPAPPITVTVTITTVPIDPSMYIGLDWVDAADQLRALGFVVDDRTAKRSSEDKGVVVDVEIHPGDGTPQRVTLVVSDGKGRGDDDD